MTDPRRSPRSGPTLAPPFGVVIRVVKVRVAAAAQRPGPARVPAQRNSERARRGAPGPCGSRLVRSGCGSFIIIIIIILLLLIIIIIIIPAAAAAAAAAAATVATTSTVTTSTIYHY